MYYQVMVILTQPCRGISQQVSIPGISPYIFHQGNWQYYSLSPSLTEVNSLIQLAFALFCFGRVNNQDQFSNLIIWRGRPPEANETYKC